MKFVVRKCLLDCSASAFQSIPDSFGSFVAGRLSRLACHRRGGMITDARTWVEIAPLMLDSLCITSFDPPWEGFWSRETIKIDNKKV